MAYPSMALLSKAGTSKAARWESASTQPSASGKDTSMTCGFSSAACNKNSSAFSIGIKAEDIQYILETRPLFYNGRRGQVTNYKSQVSSLKSQVSSLKSQVSSLKSQVSSLKSQVSSLKSQVSSLKSQVSSLKSQQ